jgi:2-iminoacetate synthase
MEKIESNIMDTVLKETENYNYNLYSDKDVENVLNKNSISKDDFKILLSPVAVNFLEQIAQKAKLETKKYFGNSISLFTPLYISNYCENYCEYCGFNCKNKIKRAKLSLKEIEEELAVIAETGLKEILILTGESRKFSDIFYIGESIKIAKKYFNIIGIEIYPIDSEEYSFLHNCGADFVSVYQETYNKKKYDQVHISGPKKIFHYRFNAQERAIKGGMRGVSFGALLGLDDYRKDAFSAGLHAKLIQQKYPNVEISFSVPRLRPFINNSENHSFVTESQLLQVMLAYRLFMPFAGMTISTRESEKFRNNVIGLCATKISAGVKVGIGGHKTEEKGDEQFEISDSRSVLEIHDFILSKKLQPVYTDYLYL